MCSSLVGLYMKPTIRANIHTGMKLASASFRCGEYNATVAIHEIDRWHYHTSYLIQCFFSVSSLCSNIFIQFLGICLTCSICILFQIQNVSDFFYCHKLFAVKFPMKSPCCMGDWFTPIFQAVRFCPKTVDVYLRLWPNPSLRALRWGLPSGWSGRCCQAFRGGMPLMFTSKMLLVHDILKMVVDIWMFPKIVVPPNHPF